MIKRTAIFLAAIAFAVAPATAEDDATPVKDFLLAADKGDTEAMAAAMDPKRGISSKKLLRKLEGCYLRRAYGGPSAQMIAAWMCDEGKNKSRVVLLDVSKTPDGALVEIASERKTDIPAPPRTGSAFGEAGE